MLTISRLGFRIGVALARRSLRLLPAEQPTRVYAEGSLAVMDEVRDLGFVTFVPTRS